MRNIVSLLVVSFGFFGLAQNDVLNEDGTISSYAKRELLIATFNDLDIEGVTFDIEKDYFVVVTKDDCENNEFEAKEMQRRAMLSSFNQALGHINYFKEKGYSVFYDCQLNGMIFKTNIVCMGGFKS